MCGTSSINQVGANPVNIKWKVVRGDTATLRVDFLEDDEITTIDIDSWTFTSSAYDASGETTDELDVTAYDGYIIITADADTTKFWGTGYSGIVANLPFDLEIDTGDNVVWTPIIGTITVYSDISGDL